MSILNLFCEKNSYLIFMNVKLPLCNSFYMKVKLPVCKNLTQTENIELTF